MRTSRIKKKKKGRKKKSTRLRFARFQKGRLLLPAASRDRDIQTAYETCMWGRSLVFSPTLVILKKRTYSEKHRRVNPYAPAGPTTSMNSPSSPFPRSLPPIKTPPLSSSAFKKERAASCSSLCVPSFLLLYQRHQHRRIEIRWLALSTVLLLSLPLSPTGSRS